MPKHLYKAAAKALSEMVKQLEFKRYLAEVAIKWKFNFEKAP